MGKRRRWRRGSYDSPIKSAIAAASEKKQRRKDRKREREIAGKPIPPQKSPELVVWNGPSEFKGLKQARKREVEAKRNS